MPPILRLILIAAALVLVLIVGVGLLGSGDPPTTRVEQVIPNERFAR